jgi:hypothetical protein
MCWHLHAPRGQTSNLDRATQKHPSAALRPAPLLIESALGAAERVAGLGQWP